MNLIKKPDVLQSSHTYFLKPLPSDVGNVNVGNIFVWDNSISQETDALDWRCRQVLVYYERNPTQTPNDILKEMSRYEPHPWPSCTQNIIKCLIWCQENISAPRILKTSRYLAKYKILTSTSHDLFDTTKPEVCSDQQWRIIIL